MSKKKLEINKENPAPMEEKGAAWEVGWYRAYDEFVRQREHRIL